MFDLRSAAWSILACGLALVAVAGPANAKSPAQTLYKFCSEANCSDGSISFAGLIMDGAGNLYGTTTRGGNPSGLCNDGCGVVFKLAPDGTETVLYSFCSQVKCSDGATPEAGLVMDDAGNLYGTTSAGGSVAFSCNGVNDGCGTVFKLAPDGTETVLYTFCPAFRCLDGYDPQAGLIMDGAGNLYGTTTFGGAHGDGTVFEVTAGGTQSVLYSFCAVGRFCTDGKEPVAGLLMDGSGNLYGTTEAGGANSGGAVFELAPGGTESVLYSFGQTAGDGTAPVAGVIMDATGNLYGTTVAGGASGAGIVFAVAPDGTETILHSFAGGSDGYAPMAGLLSDTAGNLYGTTYAGGVTGCKTHGGCGTVFEIAPDGTETQLYAFKGQKHGIYPQSGLIADGLGNLYGTASEGGLTRYGSGTVYKINR